MRGLVRDWSLPVGSRYSRWRISFRPLVSAAVNVKRRSDDQGINNSATPTKLINHCGSDQSLPKSLPTADESASHGCTAHVRCGGAVSRAGFRAGEMPDAAAAPLDEKLRQAYFWIVNTAIISPHYDIEYNDGPPQSFVLGDSQSRLTLPSGQSYSSFVLLPLLTFATRRKCLFVGGPGRGKTASAILMGVLAGYSVREVRRAMQHGHPQMTIADLLGNPLPADLVNAQSIEDIRIAWRQWLGMRVKIIDEYNRIPTRTQSALLTVMGDNYAEILDHIFECPESAWFLTANDDQGGGTYQVIEALRDRIDIVVQALSFNPRFLADLLVRIEENIRPEEVVPRQIVFTEAEVDRMVGGDPRGHDLCRKCAGGWSSSPASSNSAKWPATSSNTRPRTRPGWRASNGTRWRRRKPDATG